MMKPRREDRSRDPGWSVAAHGLSPFARGNRLLHEGRHLEAIRQYRRANRAPGVGPGTAGDHRVHFNLGYALGRIGRHLAASAGTARAPEWFRCLQGLAPARQRMGVR